MFSYVILVHTCASMHIHSTKLVFSLEKYDPIPNRYDKPTLLENNFSAISWYHETINALFHIWRIISKRVTMVRCIQIATPSPAKIAVASLQVQFEDRIAIIYHFSRFMRSVLLCAFLQSFDEPMKQLNK